MKIVKNSCFGGFSVSAEVYKELGIQWDEYGYISNEDLGIKDAGYYAYRSDPRLIKAIEKVGLEASSGSHAELEIVDIPDDIKYEIDDYDGVETIREAHRTW